MLAEVGLAGGQEPVRLRRHPRPKDHRREPKHVCLALVASTRELTLRRGSAAAQKSLLNISSRHRSAPFKGGLKATIRITLPLNIDNLKHVGMFVENVDHATHFSVILFGVVANDANIERASAAHSRSASTVAQNRPPGATPSE
ncbi:hypothetical protein [Cupriavidus pampae]|uniref:hypothetical protein n=1 Tax=Cupriavidus pampae TaxID=659251 RepID=UPI001CC82C44|nr:hypothetical protein [Cupriavidus pampae]